MLFVDSWRAHADADDFGLAERARVALPRKIPQPFGLGLRVGAAELMQFGIGFAFARTPVSNNRRDGERLW